MTSHEPTATRDAYAQRLRDYLASESEATLYQASLLSLAFIEHGVGPEDIVALHAESVQQVLEGRSYRDQVRASADALSFLLEVMIAYGVQYQGYMQLKLREQAREADAVAERERQRAEQAERARHDQADLLRVIAHELNTPLTAVKGYVDRAARYLAEGRQERLPRALQIASESADRLAHLIASLTEASREGPVALDLAPVDVRAVAVRACAMAAPAAAEKGIRLVAPEPGDGPLVLGHEDGLLTIFGNLLSNAVRYTPEGGQIIVSVCGDPEGVAVAVADTGVGMSDDVQGRMFDKFYRAAEALRMERQGLGLGLTIARQYAAALGGCIVVASTVGEGSTFTVRFPPMGQGVREGDRGADTQQG